MNFTKISLKLLAWVSIFTLISYVKITIFCGAKTAAFSGFVIGGPLALFYAGMGIGIGALLLRRLIGFFLFGMSLVSPFAFYVPTMAAGWYLNSRSWLIRLAVPVACMILFIIHPIGGQAWFYSFYWLIPIALSLFFPSSQFTEAFGATFVQHAVGSVLWLYCMPSTAAVWIALMPIVIVERLLYALGMIAVMQVVELSMQAFNSIRMIIHRGMVG